MRRMRNHRPQTPNQLFHQTLHNESFVFFALILLCNLLKYTTIIHSTNCLLREKTFLVLQQPKGDTPLPLVGNPVYITTYSYYCSTAVVL